MPSSAQSNSVAVVCLRCDRPFETTWLQVYRHTFPADRYCRLCREAEAADTEQRKADILWSQTCVPPEYQRARFGTFEPMPGTQHALTLAKQWAHDFRVGTA